MKRIKAYLLFTSWRYRLGIFLGLPVGLLAVGLLWKSRFADISIYGYSMMAILLLMELMADQGVFNGIQSARGYKLDFLKTSREGLWVLRQALMGDLARRFLTAAACIALGRVAKFLAAGGGLAGDLGMLLAIYVTQALGLFLTRYVRSVSLCVLISYGCIFIGELLLVLLASVSVPMLWGMDVALAVLSALASLLVVRTAVKKWKQTYFDTGGIKGV